MFCIAVRNASKQIHLRTYSQPIFIPSECISIARSRTSQRNLKYGFDVPINELVRLFKPCAEEEDWCFTLSGNLCSIFWHPLKHILTHLQYFDGNTFFSNSLLLQSLSLSFLPSTSPPLLSYFLLKALLLIDYTRKT